MVEQGATAAASKDSGVIYDMAFNAATQRANQKSLNWPMCRSTGAEGGNGIRGGDSVDGAGRNAIAPTLS